MSSRVLSESFTENPPRQRDDSQFYRAVRLGQRQLSQFALLHRAGTLNGFVIFLVAEQFFGHTHRSLTFSQR